MDLNTAKKIYKDSPSELRTALEDKFGKRSLSSDICDMIQSLEDVYELNSTSYDKVVPFKDSQDAGEISTNADAIIKQITKAYNQGTILDWDNRSQAKYYLYFQKAHGGWVLCGVNGSHYRALLGSGHYFKSEKLARDAYSKFQDVWNNYLGK